MSIKAISCIKRQICFSFPVLAHQVVLVARVPCQLPHTVTQRLQKMFTNQTYQVKVRGGLAFRLVIKNEREIDKTAHCFLTDRAEKCAPIPLRLLTDPELELSAPKKVGNCPPYLAHRSLTCSSSAAALKYARYTCKQGPLPLMYHRRMYAKPIGQPADRLLALQHLRHNPSFKLW